MWNEWSVQLDHWCDSHDEASLIFVMSRWSAWSLVPARERLEEEPVKTHMLRAHRLGALFNKDNPHTGRHERASATYGTSDGDWSTTKETVSLGTYLYGAIILVGLLIHEQLEGMRRNRRQVAKVGSQSLLYYTGQFIRE